MSAPCSKVLIGFLKPLRLMQMPACEYTCALLNLTSGCIGAAQPLAKARCVVLHTEWCMMQLSRVLQPIALPDVEGLDSIKVGQRPHNSCAWSRGPHAHSCGSMLPSS